MIDIKVHDMNEYEQMNELYKVAKIFKEKCKEIGVTHADINLFTLGSMSISIYVPHDIDAPTFEVVEGRFTDSEVTIERKSYERG